MSVTTLSVGEPFAAPAKASSSEAAAEKTEALPYMPQLDAVRAFAVFAVMTCHLYPSPYTSQAGGQGVTLFFVLSGFLITGILLKCRTYVARGQSRLFTLRQFYVRRFLRIFPLYYFVLAVLWIIHDPTIRAHPVWHLAYLSNVLESIQAAHLYFPQSSVGHFWSLAVEEQFYLVWPWVVLFLPRRALIWAVTGLIFCASAFRLIAFSLKIPPVAVVHLPMFWLDALGLGALLALVVDPSFGLRRHLARARFFALLIGIACLGLAFYLTSAERHFTLRETLRPLGYSLTFVWLVSSAADGFKGPVGRLMSWKPLLWIGAISYGIYVFHFIIRSYSMSLSKLPTIPSPLLRALALSAVSILVAAVSFYAYERPLNRLRRFFDYRANHSKKPAPAQMPARS